MRAAEPRPRPGEGPGRETEGTEGPEGSNGPEPGPGNAGKGEEFRDDLRGTAAVVADPAQAQAAGGRPGVHNVRKLLPAELLAELTRLDPVRSTFAVAQTVGLLAILIFIGWNYFMWWLVPVIVVLIGIQQHALFVLAHDAAHYRLYESRRLNDALGRLFGTVGGISVCSYRVIHRLHHNALYSEVDPDIALHGGYPRGKAYLVKKLLKDLAGLSAFKTFAYFFGNPAINAQTATAQRPLDDTSLALRQAAQRDRWGVVAFHIAAPAACFAAGGAEMLLKYLVLWPLPLLTVIQPILRLRAICEHGAVTDLATPLTAARTNLARPFARFVLFPHHVNYHIEHHLFPAVPHYKLPRLHAALSERGMLVHAEMRPVRETLSAVFAPRRAGVKTATQSRRANEKRRSHAP